MRRHVEGHHAEPGVQKRSHKVNQLRAISLPTVDQNHRRPPAPTPAGNLLLAYREMRRDSRHACDLRRSPARCPPGREEPPSGTLLGNSRSDRGEHFQPQPDNPQLRGPSPNRRALAWQLATRSEHRVLVTCGILPTRFSVKQVVVETALATKAPSLVPGPGKRPLANRVLANCTSTRSFVRTNASRVPHLGPLLWHLHHLLLSCWMLCNRTIVLFS